MLIFYVGSNKYERLDGKIGGFWKFLDSAGARCIQFQISGGNVAVGLTPGTKQSC